MGVIDGKLEFSDAQALANKSSGVTTVSEDLVDLSSGRTQKNDWAGTLTTFDISKSEWAVRVNTALVGAGAAIVAKLVTKASASSISSGYTTIASVTVPALSAAGTKFAVPLKVGQTALRYLGVLYTASGAKLTSAKFDSFIGAAAD